MQQQLCSLWTIGKLWPTVQPLHIHTAITPDTVTTQPRPQTSTQRMAAQGCASAEAAGI